MIETLLPKACFEEENGNSLKMMELYIKYDIHIYI